MTRWWRPARHPIESAHRCPLPLAPVVEACHQPVGLPPYEWRTRKQRYLRLALASPPEWSEKDGPESVPTASCPTPPHLALIVPPYLPSTVASPHSKLH